MDVGFGDTRICKHLPDGIESSPEEVPTQFLESGPSERRGKVDALEKRIDFNGRARSKGSSHAEP